MKDQFVTVATFTYVHEAQMLKARLELEGIEYMATNENILSANPLYSTAVGGIDIKVKGSDVEKVLAIINTNNSAEVENMRNSGNDETYTDIEEEEPFKEEVKQSHNAFLKWGVLLVIIFAIMYFAMLISNQ